MGNNGGEGLWREAMGGGAVAVDHTAEHGDRKSEIFLRRLDLQSTIRSQPSLSGDMTDQRNR